MTTVFGRRVRNLFIIFVFCASASKVLGQSVEFKFSNRIQFFSQPVGPNQLPEPVSLITDLKFDFAVDDSDRRGLQKVFQTISTAEELSAKIELFHFESASSVQENYFSQQITIFKGPQLIGLCTAYFSIEQRFLVPGACSGVIENRLFGLTLSK